MMTMIRPASVLLIALLLAGCFGGAKVPDTLLTLTSQSAAPANAVRAAPVGEAVTIDTPVIARELRTVRIPVQVSPTAIAYVKDVQWADTPDRLFQRLLSETVRRTTSRVVLDPRQSSLDPGLKVTGALHSFGYDAASGSAVVVYDAALSAAGGSRVETRRFTASVPSSSDKDAIGPALNDAANRVAAEVAQWIAG